MIVAFELSMPGRNSWNGKWSGEGRPYVIVKSFRRNPPKLGRYGYNFGDGWYASVNAREVSQSEARTLRAKSKGFCGYDWMVESIIQDGAIYGPTQPKPELETA